MAKTELDGFDRALLGLVQANNLTPARILAEKVGLSESAVLRRLRRLRKSGVIMRDVSIVRPASLGRPLTLIVFLSLARETLVQIEKFTRALKKRPEVVSAWYVTGETDFVLLLQLADMAEYETFTQEVFMSDPNISRFTTLVSMRQAIGGNVS
jgi:Lrp/AsnC family transcriptional regulator, leucine-responsive regulatory protein